MRAGQISNAQMMSLPGCPLPLQIMPMSSIYTQAQPLKMNPPTHPAFPPPYQPQIKPKHAQRQSVSPTPSPTSAHSDSNCAQTVPGRTGSEDSAVDFADRNGRGRQQSETNEESDNNSEASGQRSDRKRERNRVAAARCRQRKMVCHLGNGCFLYRIFV